MPMVSIKRYLNSNGTETTLRKVVALLIGTVGECAVESDRRELENFRNEMRATLEALTTDLPGENMMVLAGSAAQGLETYNRRITRRIARLGSDFQEIVKMLQKSLVTVAGANTDSAEGLNRMGQDLERGAGFKDLES